MEPPECKGLLRYYKNIQAPLPSFVLPQHTAVTIILHSESDELYDMYAHIQTQIREMQTLPENFAEYKKKKKSAAGLDQRVALRFIQ